MTIGEIFLDNERHMVYVDNKGIELTYKEYELLKLLMRNAGIVLSREMIMERVWDTEFEGNPEPLICISRLFVKSWAIAVNISRQCVMWDM